MDNLNVFKDFFSTQPSSASLLDIVHAIRTSQKLRSITEAYRTTHDHRIKESSTAFAVAVYFEGGKGASHIKRYTGLSIVDLDHVSKEKLSQVKQIICKDGHTLMCYTTVSGEGLRIIFRYEMIPDAQLDKLAKYYVHPFLAGNSYYQKLTGQAFDPLCKNATRLSGMAYDPEAYFNPEAVAFSSEEIEQLSSAAYKQSKEDKARQRIQNYYDNVVKPRLEADGIKYESGNHNNYVMRVGYMLADKGYQRKVAIKWAVEKFKEYDGTEQVFNSCFDNSSHPQRSAGDSKTATVKQIEDYLTAHVQLRYNIVLSRVEMLKDEGWALVEDRELNDFWRSISKEMRANASDVIRVIESSYVKVYNPFVSYLEKADQDADNDTNYIHELAQTVRVKGDEAEQQLWEEYLRKWLVAMIAGWVSTDKANHVVLILIGPQGSYKSTWERCLLPPELSQYFSVKTNSSRMTKDDRISLSIKGLICCEELDEMTPAELNQFKSVVTMTYIDERGAYKHYEEHKKRYASFCGNGNSTDFLTDTTGNRRWLPFEIESIQSPLEHPFPYTGIYAQAYRLYKSGFNYWFTQQEIELLNRHNFNFEAPNAERELVSIYFRKLTATEHGEFITAARAMQIIGGNVTQKMSLKKIAQAFIDLGFERTRVKNVRGFIAIERTAQEIKNYQKAAMLAT